MYVSGNGLCVSSDGVMCVSSDGVMYVSVVMCVCQYRWCDLCQL